MAEKTNSSNEVSQEMKSGWNGHIQSKPEEKPKAPWPLGTSRGYREDVDLMSPEFTSEEILKALDKNEDGDAELFIKCFRNRFVYDHAVGLWLQFDHHFWALDEIDEVTASIHAIVKLYAKQATKQAWLRQKAEMRGSQMEAEKARKLEDALLKRVRVLQSTNRKANVLRLARAGKKSLGITGNEWDQGSMVLVCMNGVINLKDGNFRNGRPEDYVKTIAPVKWEGLDAMAPTWGNFLEDVFEADHDLISYVQRLFGYAITGKTTEHIYPIFWGEGRNGKGTLFETIGHVLGDMAGPIEAEMILMQKFTRHAGGPASDIMALRGKRIVWASETDEGRKLSAGRLKWLTGGDTLTGRAPYGRRQISFKPTHTLLLMTNSKPHAPANDFALWSRIHLIPFNKAFVSDPKGTDQKKADPELPSRLRAEACGILAWLVQGCLEWQRQGLNPPETVKVATQGYRQEEDLMGLFIEDRCEVSESATVKAGALYKTYQAWCGDMGHKPMSGTAFGKEMKTRFDFVKERHIRYIGIGLLEN